MTSSTREPPREVKQRLEVIRGEIRALLERNAKINAEISMATVRLDGKSLSTLTYDEISDRTVALRAEKRANKHTLRGLKNERKTIKMCVFAYEALLEDAYRQFSR